MPVQVNIWSLTKLPVILTSFKSLIPALILKVAEVVIGFWVAVNPVPKLILKTVPVGNKALASSAAILLILLDNKFKRYVLLLIGIFYY